MTHLEATIMYILNMLATILREFIAKSAIWDVLMSLLNCVGLTNQNNGTKVPIIFNKLCISSVYTYVRTYQWYINNQWRL